MNVAFLFPGQGAQQVGMMADLAEASLAAREVFDRADAQLGYSLSELCFNGPARRLNATDVSQPAIFVCSAAALAAMKDALGEKVPATRMMAGLSLGEYTALYAADALDFGAALDLVDQRGQYMQEAAEACPGGMISILGLDEEKVLALCAAAAEGDPGALVPANFNCPGQIVISGSADACRRAAEMAADFGASGAVPLQVAGAFHSPFMRPAAERLAQAIRQAEIRRPRQPVIANVTAAPHQGAEAIRQGLVAQMTSPVRWWQSMQYMLDDGVEAFYEIGPGRVLAGLMRRIRRTAQVKSINSADALARLAGELAGRGGFRR
jgi:[acyl-carrier-protein] S-malonyltransferase